MTNFLEKRQLPFESDDEGKLGRCFCPEKVDVRVLLSFVASSLHLGYFLLRFQGVNE